MPYRGWKHRCPAQGGGEIIGPNEVCGDCGAHGEYVGWRSSMHDAMALYEQFYELAAIGPHRPYGDQLFSTAVNTCRHCHGSGFLDADDGESGLSCPICNGLGRTLACRPDEFIALRNLVLERFPKAARRTMILLERLSSPPWKDDNQMA